MPVPLKKEIREEIIYHTAFIETALDDPEHISVDGYGEKLKITVDKLLEKIAEIKQENSDLRVYLGASKNREEFYEKFGFIKRIDNLRILLVFRHNHM